MKAGAAHDDGRRWHVVAAEQGGAQAWRLNLRPGTGQIHRSQKMSSTRKTPLTQPDVMK